MLVCRLMFFKLSRKDKYFCWNIYICISKHCLLPQKCKLSRTLFVVVFIFRFSRIYIKRHLIWFSSPSNCKVAEKNIAFTDPVHNSIIDKYHEAYSTEVCFTPSYSIKNIQINLIKNIQINL